MNVPVFVAPSPEGEIPSYVEVKPWLAADLHSRADAAENAASSHTGNLYGWDFEGRAEVFGEIAEIVADLSTQESLVALRRARLDLEHQRHGITSVDLHDADQRRDQEFHRSNGQAKACAEVADIVGTVLSVLRGPGGHHPAQPPNSAGRRVRPQR